MKELKYSEILKTNEELGKKMTAVSYEIVVLSNIVTFPLSDLLEYHLRTSGINARVSSGKFDNILQESEKVKCANLVIIFMELSNLTEGLYYRASLMNDEYRNSLLSRAKSEIDRILSNLNNNSLVIFNTFSSLIFENSLPVEGHLESLSLELNRYLSVHRPNNVILIDIDKVIATLSIERSFNCRFFYSSQSLYTVDFYRNYVEFVKPLLMSVNGKGLKALVFDCDNTLWKNILGEDGYEGIEMSSETNDGKLFHEIQTLALDLHRNGVLIGLCSRNNPQDVQRVIEQHPDMILREDHISIKRINWKDKVNNLMSISRELNIGLDAMAYIDDSDFEIENIRINLPEVTTLQVPKDLTEYPKFFRKSMGLFYKFSKTEEDSQRRQMYLQEKTRETERTKYNSTDDFLKSLGLKVKVFHNPQDTTERMSQLTQKTNQFNLTTRRYTRSEVEKLLKNSLNHLFLSQVEDRFGNYGHCGFCICKISEDSKTAVIDSFLLSCRVLGRNIETAIFAYVAHYLANQGVEELRANYIRSPKNNQVSDFYDRMGFEVTYENENEKSYRLSLSQHRTTPIPYIEVEHG